MKPPFASMQSAPLAFAIYDALYLSSANQPDRLIPTGDTIVALLRVIARVAVYGGIPPKQIDAFVAQAGATLRARIVKEIAGSRGPVR